MCLSSNQITLLTYHAQMLILLLFFSKIHFEMIFLYSKSWDFRFCVAFSKKKKISIEGKMTCIYSVSFIYNLRITWYLFWFKCSGGGWLGKCWASEWTREKETRRSSRCIMSYFATKQKKQLRKVIGKCQITGDCSELL